MQEKYLYSANDDVHIVQTVTDVLTFNTGGVEKGRYNHIIMVNC